MTPKKLIHVQKAQGLTSKALADKIGVTKGAVDKWRRGFPIPKIAVNLFRAWGWIHD